MLNTDVATCGTSCSACPVPANGTATCDGTSCGISCNTGYVPMGGSCVVPCNTCDPSATVVALPGGRYTGTTSGASNFAGTCGGGGAPEAIYKLVLTVSSDVFVTTHGTGFNTVVYMRSNCCSGTEVNCNDDADGRTTSVLSEHGLAAGTYYVFVDGATAAATGAFSADIYVSPASPNPSEACGNVTRVTNAGIASVSNCAYGPNFDPSGTCGSTLPATGPDLVYYFLLDAPTTVTFDTCSNTCVDTVLYVRDICTDTTSQRICADDSCRASGTCYQNPAQVQSRISVALSAGPHYVIVDQYSPAPASLPCGSFSLHPIGVP